MSVALSNDSFLSSLIIILIQRGWSNFKSFPSTNLRVTELNVHFLYLQYKVSHFSSEPYHVRIQRGDRRSGPPLENYKNIGFLSNIGPDPLKITKLPNQYSMLGHLRPASETPFKWRFAGGPLMVANSGIWILPSLIKLKRNNAYKKRCQSRTPSDKTFWIRACICCCFYTKGDFSTNTSKLKIFLGFSGNLMQWRKAVCNFGKG